MYTCNKFKMNLFNTPYYTVGKHKVCEECYE